MTNAANTTTTYLTCWCGEETRWDSDGYAICPDHGEKVVPSPAGGQPFCIGDQPTCESCGEDVELKDKKWVHNGLNGTGPRCWPGRDFWAKPAEA